VDSLGDQGPSLVIPLQLHAHVSEAPVVIPLHGNLSTCRFILIERTPTPRGGEQVAIYKQVAIENVPESRTGRKMTLPQEPPPKWINFGGGSSGGVLFLPVLD